MSKLSFLALGALLGVTACSAERVSYFPSYKLKVIQGNQLDAYAVASLKAGMSRNQVQLLLGTPLLRDPFHANRWDYTYNTSRNGIIEENRTLTVYFENDQLVRAEGDAIQYAIEQLKADNALAPNPEAAQQSSQPQTQSQGK